MKALTLWNPWAVLASLGLKGWETRSWYPPHSLDGQYFAIHGALTMPRAARDFANDPAVADALRPHFPHLYVWQERKAPAMGIGATSPTTDRRAFQLECSPSRDWGL